MPLFNHSRTPSLSLLYLALCTTTVCAALSAQQPDLTVGSFDRTQLVNDWQANTIAGILKVQISNAGTASAAKPFTVQVFEDTNRNGVFDQGTDRDFGTGAVASLAAGTKTVVDVKIDTSTRFRNDLIFALVDSTNTVIESDETNNQNDSGRSCLVQPKPGPLQPALEWSWNKSSIEPNALNVMMTPSIIDLDGDGIPEVVFGSTASTGGGRVETGFLRVINGRTGVEQFTINAPSLLLNTTTSLACGDIDGDGRPEIIACDNTGTRLIAFEHDGTFKWRSVSLGSLGWGAVALADLDQDGDVEIIIGKTVLDHNGVVVWTGTGGSATTSGQISTIADIDLDGKPNVVAGNTAYRQDGTILWQIPLTDGHNATANFDNDPEAEIVLVTSGRVYLLEHDGKIKWGPVTLPGGGVGGPPTIADYDNDGEPEIGVAGASRYTVFETNGTVKWAAVTQDRSSNVTGSSVFDFDGDGEAEVIYRDELKLRVYRGKDGTVLWEVAMSSCTWHEYVQVADVDADGNAEIIAVANNNCGFGPQRGVYSYGAAKDDWVATRKIWNQHAYHVTNINDDGTIPQFENTNWLFPASKPLNNDRQNVLNGRSPTSAPDLTASQIVLPCTGSQSVTARIGNGGAIFAPSGIKVSFYQGDPNNNGILLGTVATSLKLEPGEFEDVTWPLPPQTSLTGGIYASADDDGTGTGQHSECDETNNTHSLRMCSTTASWTNYGSGYPGALGIPGIRLSAPPTLGTTVDLLVDNSVGQATPGCFFFGFKRTSMATPYGGAILVAQIVEFPVPVAAGTARFPLAFPCAHELCGQTFTMQMLEFDAAATHAVSFTPGLEAVLGR